MKDQCAFQLHTLEYHCVFRVTEHERRYQVIPCVMSIFWSVLGETFSIAPGQVLFNGNTNAWQDFRQNGQMYCRNPTVSYSLQRSHEKMDVSKADILHFNATKAVEKAWKKCMGAV